VKVHPSILFVFPSDGQGLMLCSRPASVSKRSSLHLQITFLKHWHSLGNLWLCL